MDKTIFECERSQASRKWQRTTTVILNGQNVEWVNSITFRREFFYFFLELSFDNQLQNGLR